MTGPGADPPRPGPQAQPRWLRLVALTAWGWGCWVLLTWTRTAEQLLTGLIVALAVAALLTPLGSVALPWRLLSPRRWRGLLAFGASAAWRVSAANLRLARRIWSPRRPLSSGMVLLPTRARSDAELTLVGLTTSLVVESQLVDLDRARHLLQYHLVAVPDSTSDGYRAVNGPVERHLPDLLGGRR